MTKPLLTGQTVYKGGVSMLIFEKAEQEDNVAYFL